MGRVADYARQWSRAKILRFLAAWDESVDAEDVADRFGLPNGRSAAWLARTLRYRVRIRSKRGQAVNNGRFGSHGEPSVITAATIYDAEGRAVAVMDPITRARTALRA